MMRVLLSKDVDGLGRSGETVEVPSGYARSFLLAKSLGIAAPPRRGRDPAQASAADAAREPDPVMPGAGYRRPAPTTPQCVEQNVRVAAERAGPTAGSVTVRFALGRTGIPDLVSVDPGPDRPARLSSRLQEGVTSAIRGCRFVPGADEQGRPVRLWVVMQVQLGG